MSKSAEDFQPLNKDELLKDPEVMEGAFKQCWEDGNIKGALYFFSRFEELKGRSNIVTPKEQNKLILLLTRMRKTGLHF